MELKEGMYVRTNEGKITKLVEIDEDGFKRFDKFVDFTNYEIIGEPSYNIIDLIEAGDYVNGYKVCEIIEKGQKSYNGEIAKEKCFCLDNNYNLKFYDNEIETIVTKEQFEAMKYEIK